MIMQKIKYFFFASVKKMYDFSIVIKLERLKKHTLGNQINITF